MNLNLGHMINYLKQFGIQIELLDKKLNIMMILLVELLNMVILCGLDLFGMEKRN